MTVTNDQVMDHPVPKDPMIGKMKKLREQLGARGWIRREMDLKVGESVALPAWNDELHRGTVTAVESDRFRVTWKRENDSRGRALPRARYWYSIDLLDHFVRGTG